MKRFIDWIMTKIGNSEGYGHCSHCKRTWNTVRGLSIKYSKSSGMFPLCRDCFLELPIESVEYYIDVLVDMWKPYHDDLPPSKIRRNAKASARAIKRRVL